MVSKFENALKLFLVMTIKESDIFALKEEVPEVIEAKDLNLNVLNVLAGIGAIEVLKEINARVTIQDQFVEGIIEKEVKFTEIEGEDKDDVVSKIDYQQG